MQEFSAKETQIVQDLPKGKRSISLKNEQERSGLLMRSINALREEGFATDFELRVESERIPVHRLVLAASSRYFKAMLGHDMKESNQGYVDIKGLDGASVKACIDYLYSGTIELDGMESVGQVLQTCDLLQVNDLKQGIFKHLLSNIDSQSCLYVRKYALTYSAKQSTQQECDKFLATNLATVACGDEWGHLSMDEVSYCIRLSQDKNMSTLWTSVVNWVEKDRVVRSEVLLDLLQLITPSDVNNEDQNSIAVMPASLGRTPHQQVHAVVRGTPNSRNVTPFSSNAGMIQRTSRFDFATILTDILGHPLIAEKEDCMSFLLKTAIEPHIADVARHVTVTNCFNLYSLCKSFQSESLCAIVMRFMTQNCPALSNSERMKDLDHGDFTFLLENAIRSTEQHKFQALAKWTNGESTRKREFLRFFRKLDLKKLSPDFIQNVVRTNAVVKEHPECNEVIMDAFYNHTKRYDGRYGPGRY